jgi:hypothetical protein
VHAHVQMLVSVVKMATVLADVLPKNSVLLCVFRGQKDSMQRVFIKKCFLFTVGSVWAEKRSRGFSDGEEVETEVRKWMRQQSKTLLC